jgi:phenylpropionate dioxygenase-like ring-hydroxylating dioxygenase large terminal subunit
MASSTSAGKKITGGLPARLNTDARQHWYALALSPDVPGPAKGLVGVKAPNPMSTSILGDPIVLWRDASGQARCVADKCPHRSAPLSLGRVDGSTGDIECPYHGWQMEGKTGAVTLIPALLEGDNIPPNAKVRVYPTFEQDGVVYVWPGKAEDSETAPKPPKDEADDGMHLACATSGYVLQSFCMDLPIDHSLMIENLLDPAHVPIAHEGTIGNRKRSKGLHMDMFELQNGFVGKVDENSCNGFVAPSNIVLHTPIKKGSMEMWQFVACTPTAPGQFRMVYRAYRNWAKWVDMIPPLKRMFDSFSLKIIFQDYNLLLGQQYRLREKALPWNSSIQVDCLPILYRKYWKKTFGDTSKNGPWFAGWDGSMDVEELDRLGGFDHDFDCGGCAIPKRPHHPQNLLEISGLPGNAIRPTKQPGSRSMMLRVLAVAAIAAFLYRRNR